MSKLNQVLVTYSDFVRLCRIEGDQANLLQNLELRSDGVYMLPPESLEEFRGLTSTEMADLTEHHLGDLEKPCLAFPCSLKDLQEFQEFYGLYGLTDGFDLAEWLLDKHGAVEKPLGTRERDNYLKIVFGLVQSQLGTEIDLGRHHKVAVALKELLELKGIHFSEQKLANIVKELKRISVDMEQREP